MLYAPERKLQRENSSLSIQANNQFKSKQSLSKILNSNFSLYPNRVLASIVKKHDSSKLKSTTNKNQTGKTVKYCATKNTGLNKFSQNAEHRSHDYSTKYIQYKRDWDDILVKSKRRHENKWKMNQSNTAKLEDFELQQTLGNGIFFQIS